MIRDKNEFVLCAANYYNDETVHDYQPTNIKIGFIKTSVNAPGMKHHFQLAILLFRRMWSNLRNPFSSNGISINSPCWFHIENSGDAFLSSSWFGNWSNEIFLELFYNIYNFIGGNFLSVIDEAHQHSLSVWNWQLKEKIAESKANYQ